jgi:hypothetical protein
VSYFPDQKTEPASPLETNSISDRHEPEAVTNLGSEAQKSLARKFKNIMPPAIHRRQSRWIKAALARVSE